MSAKRQVDRNLGEVSGKGKLPKLTGAEFVLRVLCPVSRVGFLDGPSVEQQTGASVGIQELVPGSDERVVVIGFSEEKGRDNPNTKNGGLSSIQAALMVVFERMTEAEEDKGSACAIRVLVKNGSEIKEMESGTGARTVVVPRDQLPPCVSASDELIQITGEVDAIKKALQSIAKQIAENTSHWPGMESFPASLVVTSSSLPGRSIHTPEAFPTQSYASLDGSRDLNYHHSIDHPIMSRFREAGRAKPAQETLSFRLLCCSDRIGALINQGGQVIKTVQQDTGCDIRVLEAVPNSNDRVVVVAGLVHPDDRISAVQDAVLRVQSRISRAGLEINEQGATARLLISSNQISCLLGKGGSVIAEMRKLSGAHIHVLPKDLLPKCASEDEEMVQIDGDFEAVQKGLVQVTTRLQHHFFVEAFPSRSNISPNPAFSDQSLLPPLPFMASTELSIHGPPFPKSDIFGIRRGQDCYPLINDIHQFGGATHISDRRHWGPQGLLEGLDPGLLEFGGRPQRRVFELLGRDLPADIIPSTTVEVIVPRSVVPVIYGEDGECLKQIREFCDAEITIVGSKPEEVETTIVIYGTPEQTHAAQSLIQAFVISETGST